MRNCGKETLMLEKMLNTVEFEAAEFFRVYANARLEEGWSMNDVVAWLNCMEEFNPELDEKTALARMAAIQSKYL